MCGRRFPVVDFLVGPVFGFSFRAGAQTTLLRVSSLTDSSLQVRVDQLFDFSPRGLILSLGH
jgi:hypothetical protein